MGYLPIFVNVSGRTCVVVGGGQVAERKARTLIAAGAHVVLISPQVTAGLATMVEASAIRHLSRSYCQGDLEGAWLTFEATGDDLAARAVASEARQRGVPINVADVPELCTFIAPAVVQRGGLQIAISTGGASPALARKIREELEEGFGIEYEVIIDLLAQARQWLRTCEPDGGARARLLAALVSSDLLQCVKHGDFAAADAIVRGVLGKGLAEIGFDAERMKDASDRDSAWSGHTDARARLSTR